MAIYWHQTMILLSLFFIYFGLASSTSFSSKQHVMCHEDDLSALLKFKQSFSVNDVCASGSVEAYPKLASWKLNGSDCCSWDGVVCSEDDTGHVIGLDLGSSCIYGPLNSSSTLFHLVHLQSLNLTDNNFMNSQIPSAIASLSRLRRLDLSSSAFSGQIPKEISHLTHLTCLWLSKNPLLRLQNPSFKHLVQNLTQLEELSLSQVNISSQVPTILTTFTSLRLIYLIDCGLHGSLPASLNNLTKLTTLDPGRNLFTGQIPRLEGLSELTYLSLAENEFDAQYVPNWLGKLTQLQGLNLISTNLHGTMPSSLSNLTQLNYLGLTSNHINGPMPSWLMNLTKLSIMDLRDNQLRGTIPPIFSSLKNIAFLSLSRNNFSGVVKADIFLNLNKLYALGLGQNRITFTDNNNFTNVTFPQLQVLGLTSCNLKVIPDFLRTKNQLSILNMGQNYIEGQIPEWFWNNTKETLEELDLSDNLLTSFEHHPHILHHDMFQGDNAPSICQATSLHVLDLSYNSLTGLIPPCLGKMNLSVLVLKGNKFCGTIPNTFMKGNMLEIIDVKENQLKGKLPRSLTNCTMLRALDLAENNLEDVFPSWLGVLQHLQVLILRSNKFRGELKSSRASNSSQYPNLRILDLSNNSFAGNLPHEYIKCWTSMKTTYSNATYLGVDTITYGHFAWTGSQNYSMTITNKGVKREYERVLNLFTVVDLSSNKFIGEIPESIGQLHGLELLNLSNNHLSGYIPVSFQNLTNLECLDLSRNRLSGKIPQQLAQLTFLAFLNVSYNHLSGLIPKGQQFSTFQNNSYEGNPGLCGEPLSKKCGNVQVPLIDERDDDYEFPSGVDWIVISLGLGSGLVIGLIFGKYLGARHHEWFVEKFGRKQDKLVRLIRRDIGN